MEKLADEMKLELKRCQDIIFNGDRQVKEMEAHIKFLEGENLEMRNRLASVEGEVDSLRGRLTDAAMS